MSIKFRFGLTWMFAFVGILGCAIAIAVNSFREPMSGDLYNAICHANDWDMFARTRVGSVHGAFALYAFHDIEPSRLFKSFDVEPKLWKKIQLPGGVKKGWQVDAAPFNGGSLHTRPIDEPVAGTNAPKGILLVDQFRISGMLQESVLGRKRFFIDCTITLDMAAYTDSKQVLNEVTNDHLGYDGGINGNIFVFAKPIQGDLVQLIIFDVR